MYICDVRPRINALLCTLAPLLHPSEGRARSPLPFSLSDSVQRSSPRLSTLLDYLPGLRMSDIQPYPPSVSLETYDCRRRLRAYVLCSSLSLYDIEHLSCTEGAC